MQINDQITTITEGKTQILVPRGALEQKVPPRDIAFFNPRAKLSRDFSIIVYSTFLKNFDGQKSFLDGLSGLGARGLRVANEIKGTEVFVNDLNPSALELSKNSAELNGLHNYIISRSDICQFFNGFSKKGSRGAIVDIDPFGSPAKYIDCGLRATVHKGLLSISATDLQVLHGLFNDACKKKYHGTPVKTTYSNEISIRLVLGLSIAVAARLDVEATPIFVETNQHYYRVYLRILNKPDTRNNIGYIAHCRNCGNRHTTPEQIQNCTLCSHKVELAGPLWIGSLFERDFVAQMIQNIPDYSDKKCEKSIRKALLESEMPACYYTLDEIAQMLKSAPIPLEQIILRLQQNGFSASPTSLNPTGFRTDCKIDKIKELFSAQPIS
ncbi:tRNA (guanine-N1)-methyltransferase [Candidatus Nitrosotenuis cloacae]|uniref:tRNA (guanine(26)-N(2))-dimethyltransferase n=1 Tax=Candidatus Nitrosotenuis cloacae TaxID=1603555 RepID=A0A3G1B434_9ARCH|nr:tRNA (guanine-N1)-methyltransferase [Candidatus Nitrosotenuis cloacae]AJZ76423.1 tRNA (guanine-N1)-methyltransferase [Candidatus Nitrosotenuis cloacae]